MHFSSFSFLVIVVTLQCLSANFANPMYEKGIVVGYLMAIDPSFATFQRRSSLPAIIPKDSELRNQLQRMLYPTKSDKLRMTLKTK